MLRIDCRVNRGDLDAFVDGELRGARVLDVLRHLESCRACTAYVDDLRQIGEQLRVEGTADPDARVFDGLASTVVSRTRAEHAASWRALARRASEDWHWVLVGAGAMTATIVSTAILSVILAFGPRPQRDDSLSALIAHSAWSRGDVILVYATPAGTDRGLFFVNDAYYGWGRDSRAVANLASQVVDRSTPEPELVNALLELMTREGALDRMDPRDRDHAESLLQQINSRRANGPAPLGAPLYVHEVRYWTETSVSAKGL